MVSATVVTHLFPTVLVIILFAIAKCQHCLNTVSSFVATEKFNIGISINENYYPATQYSQCFS